MAGSYEVGQSAEYQKTVTEKDVVGFAEITGDKNPVHLDQAYAEKTMFKTRIAHGMLVGSLFSTIFGTIFPGEGTIYLGQQLSFRKPVLLGDTITARVELSALREDKPIGTFTTVCTNQNGDVVVKGEATLLMP